MLFRSHGRLITIVYRKRIETSYNACKRVILQQTISDFDNTDSTARF
jgi:hypothetical protein